MHELHRKLDSNGWVTQIIQGPFYRRPYKANVVDNWRERIRSYLGRSDGKEKYVLKLLSDK